jgi:hypothetical protein
MAITNYTVSNFFVNAWNTALARKLAPINSEKSYYQANYSSAIKKLDKYILDSKLNEADSKKARDTFNSQYLPSGRGDKFSYNNPEYLKLNESIYQWDILGLPELLTNWQDSEMAVSPLTLLDPKDTCLIDLANIKDSINQIDPNFTGNLTASIVSTLRVPLLSTQVVDTNTIVSEYNKYIQSISSASSINGSATQTKPAAQPASSINSSTEKKKKSLPETKSPINETIPNKSATTSTTSLDGGVTSKTGELREENILEPTSSQAVNINLESKPGESKPVSSTSNTSTILNTSNSTTVNDVKSVSSNTNSPSNTSGSIGVTGDKNILKVENTNNQSSSSTVNENKPEKEKGGFLSKVGNFAKKTGAVLNLPSIGELGEQARGLFGTTGSNISSRVYEVKNSFSTALSNSPVNSSNIDNTKSTMSVAPNESTVSNTEKILKTETQNSMKVEQKSPAVAIASTPAKVVSNPAESITSTAVSNTANSQTTSSPQNTTTNTAQNTKAVNQPSVSPSEIGVNIDISQLAQSIARLERILVSGIEVTIKET